jgi:hypothetical protein
MKVGHDSGLRMASIHDALFASLRPPSEGGGEIILADTLDDHPPGVLEALLGQVEVSQLLLKFTEQEEDRRPTPHHNLLAHLLLPT